jgi:TIR domain
LSSIFISYRRKDSAGHAGWLYELLIRHFGKHRVFRDVDSMEPGLDFNEQIDQAMEGCKVLLVVMGPEWGNMVDAKGVRRLDDEQDVVRLEVARALNKEGMRVIPVLVSGAKMLSRAELPAPLAPLAMRHAIELSEAHFDRDVRDLIDDLEGIVGAAERSQATAAPSAPSPPRPRDELGALPPPVLLPQEDLSFPPPTLIQPVSLSFPAPVVTPSPGEDLSSLPPPLPGSPSPAPTPEDLSDLPPPSGPPVGAAPPGPSWQESKQQSGGSVSAFQVFRQPLPLVSSLMPYVLTEDAGLRLLHSDPARGVYEATTGLHISGPSSGWGERVTVTLSGAGEGSTKVAVESRFKVGSQVTGMERHERNLAAIFAGLTRRL